MSKKTLVALAILVGALILLDPIFDLIPWTAGDLRAELLWRYRRADLLWHFQADDRGFGSSPTVVEGVLYGSISDHVKALDAATGELIWRYETDDYWGTDLTVADGTVYVADEDVVDTLDAASGALLRRYEMGDSRWTSAPAVDEEVMYLYTNGLNLIALDLASGEILWRYHTELFFDAPVVAEGVIYVGTVRMYTPLMLSVENFSGAFHLGKIPLLPCFWRRDRCLPEAIPCQWLYLLLILRWPPASSTPAHSTDVSTPWTLSVANLFGACKSA